MKNSSGKTDTPPSIRTNAKGAKRKAGAEDAEEDTTFPPSPVNKRGTGRTAKARVVKKEEVLAEHFDTAVIEEKKDKDGTGVVEEPKADDEGIDFRSTFQLYGLILTRHRSTC